MRIFLIILAFLTIPSRVSAVVVINELFPKSADITYTWIELYNTGPDSVSMDRWKLENISSNATYILNAGAIITPNGFITLYQPQTGITFSIEGDTVRLSDEKHTLIDTQSYPGTLGYNTSMGRSTDGGSGWVICAPSPEYTATPNKSNKCPPQPTSTPSTTPAPTSTPTRSTVPSSTAVPAFIPKTPTITMDPSNRFAFPNVLGDAATHTPTPTPTPANFWGSDTYKKIWVIALLVGVGSAILIMIIGLFKSFRH